MYHIINLFDKPDLDIKDAIDTLQIVNDELVFKDLQWAERKADYDRYIIKKAKDAKFAKFELNLGEKIQNGLMEGLWLKDQEFTEEEIAYLNNESLLTAKPVIYLINFSKEIYMNESEKVQKTCQEIQKWSEQYCKGQVIPFSSEYELEHSTDESSCAEKSIINHIINTGFYQLGLNQFFTAGVQECKAWPYRKGHKAPKAAGVIHGDLEKGFISVDVIKYDDFRQLGSEAAVIKAKKIQTQGKDYIIEDGDMLHFKCHAKKK